MAGKINEAAGGAAGSAYNAAKMTPFGAAIRGGENALDLAIKVKLERCDAAACLPLACVCCSLLVYAV